MKLHRPAFKAAVLLLVLCLGGSAAAQNRESSLQGKVTDPQGAVIVGATVTVTGSDGQTRTTTTGSEGRFQVTGLTPGLYTVRATARGFDAYENLAQLSPDRLTPLDLTVQLKLAVEKEEVTVESETEALDLSQDQNAGALILRDQDLEALPDDPDDLADALLALAGPSAGPNGGQFYIDGFEGGTLPNKASIREIRINQNPFSAEFDRLGFGRIEILTRPGTSRMRGQVGFSFNDESLNSRNPFAPTRAPYQSRSFSGSISGPLVPGKAGFSLDFNRRDVSENAVVSATILDGNLNIMPFSETIVTPNVRTRVSPRFEFQLGENHTLTTRYSFQRVSQENEGVGEFSLRSRAYDSSQVEHEFNLTETAILGPRLINETRFQFERNRSEDEGDNSVPGLRVLEAFTGGGPQVGDSFNTSSRWDVQNQTSWSSGAHSVKFGMRLRNVRLSNASRSNFGGTFTFGGGLAPQLDAAGRTILDSSGNPVLVPITSIERYRRTLLFQRQGLSLQEIRRLGGGATQFSLSGGDPLAEVSRIDFSAFIQDEWRLRNDFLLSLGLRYEVQSEIADKIDLAPRLSFAWSPGAGPRIRPKTVVRGGFGLFYDRFGQNLILNAERFNGVRQQQFVVSDPDFYPLVPSLSELQLAARPQTTRRIAEDLNSPYSMQSALSLERQLPFNFTLSTSYIYMRTLHVLWSRNVNAPLPGTFQPNVPGSGIRPNPAAGDILEYQSGGTQKQHQVIVGVNNRFSRALTLFANYTWSHANSNSDGAGTFPADPYQLSSEYGRASFDVRHRFVVGGSVRLPGNISLNPFVMGSSGRQFNITLGRDVNGDTLFTERPAFATDLSKPGVIVTSLGAFDPNPAPGQPLIPRNYGEGSGFWMVNLSLSRTWGFGSLPESAESGPAAGGMHPPVMMGGGHGGPPPGGGGGRVAFGGGRGGGNTGKRYNLTLSIQASNLLNHTNLGQVIGNLSSPLFGLPNTTVSGFGFRGGPGGGFGGGPMAAGNRRVEMQLRLSF